MLVLLHHACSVPEWVQKHWDLICCADQQDSDQCFVITTTMSTNYPDCYNCGGGFLLKAGFGARLKNSNYVSEVRKQWRGSLISQAALNWQSPDQGCTTVPAKQGVSLPPVSYKGHSFILPFSSIPPFLTT